MKAYMITRQHAMWTLSGFINDEHPGTVYLYPGDVIVEVERRSVFSRSRGRSEDVTVWFAKGVVCGQFAPTEKMDFLAEVSDARRLT